MFSGAVAGLRKDMDLGGMIALSIITGVGGGSIRDVLLHRTVFWTESHWYITLGIIVGIIVFFTYHYIDKVKPKIFNYVVNFLDAVGLVPFMIAGVSIAKAYHESETICIFFGLITCIGGGILRDICCNEVPLVFKAQLYATSVVIGSMIYLLLAQINPLLAIIISACLILITRILSITYSINLPTRSHIRY
tara:strand:- start:28084 stop:28659 length:576 start_codon:yes stop_codon:yes gene_type:complete